MPVKRPNDLPPLSDIELRWRIIQEDRLRRQLARDEAMRRSDPGQWRRADAARVARNRDQKALNDRLRAAGLRPIEPEPSPRQRLKELQQLGARNRAEIATRQQQPSRFTKKSEGQAVRSTAGRRVRHGRDN